MYVCICICLYMYVCMYVCICVYMCVYVCMYICICIFTTVWVYVYVCMYVCMYVYICTMSGAGFNSGYGLPCLSPCRTGSPPRNVGIGCIVVCICPCLCLFICKYVCMFHVICHTRYALTLYYFVMNLVRPSSLLRVIDTSLRISPFDSFVCALVSVSLSGVFHR